MKKDELEIEKLAQDYFRDASRPKDLENKLLEAIYANNEFVIRIVSRALGKYSDVTIDLSELKHGAVLETFEKAKENFDYNQGKFINYFSNNLKLRTEDILKKEYKKNQELILDDPSFKKKEEDSWELEKIEPKTISDENNEKFLLVLLNSLNKLFLSTKAGKNNKSKVYAYFVLECLLCKTTDLFTKYINEYDFLKMQKQPLMEIQQEYLKNRKIPSQKEYAKITGMPENKFATIKPMMEEYLYNSPEMQDYK